MVIKRDWYQTDERVTISFFVKQAKDVTVDFGENFVSVGGKTQDGLPFTEHLTLSAQIERDQSHFKVRSTKIEVNVKKSNIGRCWNDLEHDSGVHGVGINLWTGRRSNPQRKNWDQIADNCLIGDDTKGIRRDWYQTDTHVYVTFFVKARSGSVVTGGNFVSVTGTYQDGTSFAEKLSLSSAIDSGDSPFEVLDNKIELKLKKATPGYYWKDLEDVSDGKTVKHKIIPAADGLPEMVLTTLPINLPRSTPMG